MMIKMEWEHLFRIRGKVLDEINRQRSLGEPGKSADGDMEISITIDSDGHAVCRLWLYCYLIGPGRTHEWSGRVFDDVLTMAERDIDGWIAEEVARDALKKAKVRESRAMLPCKCGCKRRKHWVALGAEMPEELRCYRCGFTVYGKNQTDVIRQWNKAVKRDD